MAKRCRFGWSTPGLLLLAPFFLVDTLTATAPGPQTERPSGQWDFDMADSPSLGFVTHDFGSMSERVQAILAGTFKQQVVSASDRADEKPTSDYQDLMKSTYVDQ